MNTISQKIDDLVSAGWNVKNTYAYTNWANRVWSLLSAGTDSQAADAFYKLGSDDSSWEDKSARQVGHLEGLALRIEASGLQQAKAEHSTIYTAVPPPAAPTKRVFVVHGHDSAAKETAARFLEKLGLEPIILHEQANEGRTIVEKFEVYSDVGFAVVLMTPDDIGASAKEKEKLTARARQNVILELGFFTGRLGRSKVCALFKPGIEIPSDINGVLFVEFDDPGVWKPKLANELVKAGIKIDIQALLQGEALQQVRDQSAYDDERFFA